MAMTRSTSPAGAPDTVICGNGSDAVRADAGDVIAGDCEVVEIV